MGIFLNPGADNLIMAKASEIYIDQSEMISYLNKIISTEARFICVSRPRRFGKTMAADMISAYYDRSVDGKVIFNNLKISSNDSFLQHLNKYDVIKITMTEFINRDSSDIRDMINTLTNDIILDLQDEYSDINLRNSKSLLRCLQLVYAKTRRQFVFIIDEWDAVFRIFIKDEKSQIAYLDFLRDLFKNRNFIALAYMTGILPVKKYGEHSALNMFREFSIEMPRQLAEFFGFTAFNVQAICKKYNVNYDECKQWYDGYMLCSSEGFNKYGKPIERVYEIYNPLSVVEAVSSGRFANYWNKTENYSALKNYIMLNIDGLKDVILKLLSGSRERVNTEKFQNDMSNFGSKDDVLTLLIHLGYLSYDIHTKEAFIPNNEIRQEFLNSIEDEKDWSEVMYAINQSEETLKYTWAGNELAVAEALNNAHFDTSLLRYNAATSLSCVVSLAYYTAKNKYEIIRELPTGKGFADLVFVPRKHYPDIPAMIVELKWNKSAYTAIQQIKDKKYSNALKDYKGNILLVGINYDRITKKHECIIEKDIITKRK